MGTHTWTRYVGYEKACCEGLKNMLNLFCFNCHTPDDVGGCHRCEIGRANLMMLAYLKDNLNPNVHFPKLLKTIEKEEDYYCFLRLRSHFRPTNVSRKYLKSYQEKYPDKKMRKMISIWAKNTEEIDRISLLIDKIKEVKPKW